MSSGFGQWYEDQKAGEEGDDANASSSSWFGDSDTLPLFDTSQYSMANLKSSMEAQMPQKVMGMNYQQRLRMFTALLFLSALFFALAFGVGMPLITVRPQKFALSFTFGSLTFMGSFGILKGPWEHVRSMLAAERLFFTSIYLGSMFATLYFTFTVGGASGYLLVLGASGCQLLALLWYLVSFLPGGSAGMSMLASALGKILKPVAVACVKLQAACVARFAGWMTRGST